MCYFQKGMCDILNYFLTCKLHMQGHCYPTASSADWWLDAGLWRRKVKPQDEPQEGKIKAYLYIFIPLTNQAQGLYCKLRTRANNIKPWWFVFADLTDWGEPPSPYWTDSWWTQRAYKVSLLMIWSVITPPLRQHTMY